MPTLKDRNCNEEVKIEVKVDDQPVYVFKKTCNTEKDFQEFWIGVRKVLNRESLNDLARTINGDVR